MYMTRHDKITTLVEQLTRLQIKQARVIANLCCVIAEESRVPAEVDIRFRPRPAAKTIAHQQNRVPSQVVKNNKRPLRIGSTIQIINPTIRTGHQSAWPKDTFGTITKLTPTWVCLTTAAGAKTWHSKKNLELLDETVARR